MDVLVCHSFAAGVTEKKYPREAKTILAGSTVQYLAGTKMRSQPGAPIINVVEDGNVPARKEAISSLCLESPEGIVKFDWPLYLCKRTIDTSGSEDPVKINTQQEQIFRVEDEPQVSHQQNYDADADESDNEVINNFGHNHSDSSDGGNDVQAQLPRSTRRRLRHFKKEKVKNDIVHIFFRFEKALSKEHGAFVDFICALRDAMFVMDQRDLDLCLQVLREKHGMSEKDMQRRMTNDFGWFLRRVKRTVPTPPELERRYMAVYEVFKDVVCTKSGKALFATKHGNSTHLSCLKHIRRNCLSDIQCLSYYFPLGEDSNGLMLYRCVRGTSALEGLYQKLRQLVRGFSTSPRLMKALVSTFCQDGITR